jgi:tRNA A37 methylthiotransferase MiaB
MARLLALADELSVAFRRAHRGTLRPVLWEEEKGGDWFGHTDNYIPVYATGTALRNRVTLAELGEVYHDGVRGHLPPEGP